MYMTYEPRARVYTYKEVKEMIKKAQLDSAAAVLKNKALLDDALAADHERAMLMLCLRALQIDGFQKAPMERLMSRVADFAEGLQNDTIDYDKDIRKPVEDCLGYAIEDKDFMADLERRIE